MATHAPAEVRRAQILDAAFHCFAGKGYHDTRIDDIGRAAGLSKGAIYHHFESKEHIFRALFEAFSLQVFAEWDALARDGEPLANLASIGEHTLMRIAETRPFLDAWTEFVRHPLGRARFGEIYRESRRRIAAEVERGVTAGALAPCDPGAVAAALTALVEGLLLQAFADPSYDPRADWPGAWAVFERGLRAQAEPART